MMKKSMMALCAVLAAAVAMGFPGDDGEAPLELHECPLLPKETKAQKDALSETIAEISRQNRPPLIPISLSMFIVFSSSGLPIYRCLTPKPDRPTPLSVGKYSITSFTKQRENCQCDSYRDRSGVPDSWKLFCSSGYIYLAGKSG